MTEKQNEVDVDGIIWESTVLPSFYYKKLNKIRKELDDLGELKKELLDFRDKK